MVLDPVGPYAGSVPPPAGQLSTGKESSAPGGQSYEGSHDGGGVAQSLDGGVGPLLEVVVVAGHVEGGEGGPAALHGPGQRAGRQRHAQPAVGGQRALDGVGQRGGAGAHGRRQRLRMLEARESRRGGDPGAEREVVRGGEGGGCESNGYTLPRRPDEQAQQRSLGERTRRHGAFGPVRSSQA